MPGNEHVPIFSQWNGIVEQDVEMKGFSIPSCNLFKAMSGFISRMYQKGNMIDVCDASLLESRSNMGVSKNRGTPKDGL